MACLSRRLLKPTWRRDFKKISADIYFWPNYDCLEEKEATIQILLETSAETHKPMQNWDKLKKARASRKGRQTSQPNATLIPTRDRPLGQLQSHLAQAWSRARRRCWHQKSSSSKSSTQFCKGTRMGSDPSTAPTCTVLRPTTLRLALPAQKSTHCMQALETRATAQLLMTQKHAGSAQHRSAEKPVSTACRPRSKGQSASGDGCSSQEWHLAASGCPPSTQPRGAAPCPRRRAHEASWEARGCTPSRWLSVPCGLSTSLWYLPTSSFPPYCSNLRKQKLRAASLPVPGSRSQPPGPAMCCRCCGCRGRQGRTAVPQTFMVVMIYFELWIWTETVLHLKCHC